MVIGYIEYKRFEEIGKLNIPDIMHEIRGDEKAQMYNRVGNILFNELGVSSAELCLICTYIVNKYLGDVEDGKN